MQEDLNLLQAGEDGPAARRWWQKLHKAICQVLSADKNKHLVHTWQEMELLESISYALSQLFNLTDFQSGKS